MFQSECEPPIPRMGLRVTHILKTESEQGKGISNGIRTKWIILFGNLEQFRSRRQDICVEKWMRNKIGDSTSTTFFLFSHKKEKV